METEQLSKQMSFLLEDFIVESPIGQGAYGQIYKAMEVGTGKIYALKAMNRRCLMKMKKQNQPIIEKNALIKCASTFVVRLYGTFKDDSNLYFVLELAEHGDLAEAVNDIGSLNTNVVRLLAAQIFEAICVCHKANVIHRDLKPENILLDENNHVLLSDFGTALMDDSGNQELIRSSIVGTPAFVAPELLNDGEICYSSDLWSFGCVIFNLLTGSAPFSGQNTVELMTNITDLKFNPAINNLPKTAKDLIVSLLKSNPRERIGFGEAQKGYPSIRNHAFFKDVDWHNLANIKMPVFTKFEEEQPTIADSILRDNEVIIFNSIISIKNKIFGWKERILFLTNQRLLFFNTKTQQLTHCMLLFGDTSATVSRDGKEWTMTYGKYRKRYTFKSNDGLAGMWASHIIRQASKSGYKH
ncbi:AGC family protein kinase [Histomonas meleagridis]|uniref:AGC family protein kinase n=1 Tax=Histomonas meleagridis TaxID=135588 RepID=UPI00355AA17B|nr:AGC family protein kinase [Histomonas meleagridis]KAH0800745.1 AGC family protein kinase [Histomonas meleagridis]